MTKALKIFYASDIHGSERVFKKLLKAAPFYKADAVIFGGDLTGKALVPIIEWSAGKHRANVFGAVHDVSTGTQLDELETYLRDCGSYPYRTTPSEMAEMETNPELVTEIFNIVMAQTAERWIALADDRLSAAGIPALMMPGNDDEPHVKALLAQGEWIVDAEAKVVDLAGYQVASFGYATTTPWHSPREVTEGDMAAALAKLAEQLAPGVPTILNLHNPPHDSGLDLAYKMNDELQVEMAGGQPMLAAVGSTAVRAAIENIRPVLSLHGHIHEFARNDADRSYDGHQPRQQLHGWCASGSAGDAQRQSRVRLSTGDGLGRIGV